MSDLQVRLHTAGGSRFAANRMRIKQRYVGAIEPLTRTGAERAGEAQNAAPGQV